jgi:hypothetical protein
MTRPTTFKLDPALAAAVDRLAASRGATRSEILREAVAAYVGGARRTAAPSISDLVGILEGPGDLSTNDAYLEGFGASRPARASTSGKRARRRRRR